MRRFVPLALMIASVASPSRADDKLKGIACRSVHLAYDAPVSSAFYAEVKAEESARGTYFMVCGWSKGYFGMQELASGKKLLLFSVWDPTSGDDPRPSPTRSAVKMLHKDDRGPREAVRQRGDRRPVLLRLRLEARRRYRFLVTARPDGDDRTAYSGYFFVPEAKAWKHLVTFSTLTPKGESLRGTYSFIEDFRRDRIERHRAPQRHLRQRLGEAPRRRMDEGPHRPLHGRQQPGPEHRRRPHRPRLLPGHRGRRREQDDEAPRSHDRRGGGRAPPADLPRAEEVPHPEQRAAGSGS